MKFAIALFSAAHAPSSRRALLFAQAALAGGHEIVRLFFLSGRGVQRLH